MKALVVDDDETLRLTVRLALESHNYEVEEAEDGVEAVEKVKNNSYDAIILDVNMPRMNGIEALEKIKEISPQSFCLVLTAHSDVKLAVRAIKGGAYDYIEKPFDTQELLKLIDSAKEANDMIEVIALSAPEVEFAEGRTMIGGSSKIKKVFDIIYKLAKVDTSVLIRGESGTGKELIAKALHFHSHRRKGPMVSVNCGAMPDNLIESELFGHEKGAFTGADRRKIGKFQYAEGGTLFLDEIGDISPAMQVKFLRVLQEKTYCPIGSNQDIKADVRIIAATNRNLESMIEKSEFRADLFYRLNVLPIKLPPLRERTEDISPLVEFMIKKFNKIHGRSILGIDPKAMNVLMEHGWPGNIRELENVIEHAFILETKKVIGLTSLPMELLFKEKIAQNRCPAVQSNFDWDDYDLNYPILKEQFEKDFIIRALKAFDGRINLTANNTKMTKITLLRKLEKYGINPREYHRH
jgi:DNA-binding NtrC family response regulator